MKKYIVLLSLFCYVFLWGQDVTESMAVDVATQYYERVKNDNHSERISGIRANNKAKSNRAPELISPLGLANMWLIPVEDGWVLVSSCTKTTPILAHYQTEQKPTYDLLAPGEQYLLNWYEHEIAYANDSCPTCECDPEWGALLHEKASGRIQTRTTTVVSPLLHTHWDQNVNNQWWQPYDCDKVYNKFCPIIDNAEDVCGRAYAGCVAVAIAQIMAYWQWPYAAQVPTTSGGSVTDLQFYDWSLMPNKIYNFSPDEHVNMIAGFLRDCGYMAHMSYGADGSGATDSHAKEALVNFGYNENTISLKKSWLTSGWQALLQAELDAGRPVYYSGTGNMFGDDGHAFVLDGYDSQGKFHINFGWGESEDDFYHLDSITYFDGTNSNHWQKAIIGIQPAPYCGSEIIDGTVIFPSKFSITAGGELVFEEKILENIEQGEIFSAAQIRLTNGFTIKEGSNVHIAIKNVPCPTVNNPVRSIHAASTEETTSAMYDMVAHTVFSLSPNPVNSILHIRTSDELSEVQIYTLNGQRVMQAAQTDIDVSNLPQGMYLLRALTAAGQQHQAKFIRE